MLDFWHSIFTSGFIVSEWERPLGVDLRGRDFISGVRSTEILHHALTFVDKTKEKGNTVGQDHVLEEEGTALGGCHFELWFPNVFF